MMRKKLWFKFINKIFPVFKGRRGAYRIKEISKSILFFDKMSKDSEGIFEITLGNSDKARFRDKKDIGPYFSEHPFVEYILKNGNKHNLLADIGGFRGFYTIISLKSGLDTSLVFEMSEKNKKILEENIELNNLSESVKISSKAVWSSSTNLKAITSEEGRSRIIESKKEGSIPSTTLDEEFENRDAPDLIKIDVEGAELNVLKGSKELLSNKSPTILLELHKNERLREFDHEPEDVLNYLENLEYKAKRVAKGQNDDLYICTKRN